MVRPKLLRQRWVIFVFLEDGDCLFKGKINLEFLHCWNATVTSMKFFDEDVSNNINEGEKDRGHVKTSVGPYRYIC